MKRKGALLVVLLAGLAGCSGRGSFTAPMEAAGIQPFEEAAPKTAETGNGITRTGCPARGEWRPTAFSRYWPYSYRIGEVAATRDQVALDWLDYDAAGEAQWYSYRYRPQHHPRDSQAWSPWFDVDGSEAIMSGLEAGSAYGVQVRAAVDHPVPGGRPDCFFTRAADRIVRTTPRHFAE